MFKVWLEYGYPMRKFFRYAAQHGYKWQNGQAVAADDYKLFKDDAFAVVRGGVLTLGYDRVAFVEFDAPSCREVIRNAVTLPTLYEQLAEELTECAKEALKAARILRGENPTPETYERARARFENELCDVMNVLDVMKEFPCGDESKIIRWAMRLDK